MERPLEPKFAGRGGSGGTALCTFLVLHLPDVITGKHGRGEVCRHKQARPFCKQPQQPRGR